MHSAAPSRRARIATRPGPADRAMPWRIAFSASGWSSSVGTAARRTSAGASISNASRSGNRSRSMSR
jgi:hypothetical protein